MNKIYRFGWRPMLFLGADRELTILLSIFSGITMFYSFNIVVIFITLMLWWICLYLLRLVAKSDPLMKYVYRNHIKYNNVYLAKSTPYCKSYKIYK